MDKEQQQLVDARRELEQIQSQLETHLNDKQSLNDELDEMKRLLGITDGDEISSVIESISREPSIRDRSKTMSSESSSKSTAKSSSVRDNISLVCGGSMYSNICSEGKKEKNRNVRDANG